MPGGDDLPEAEVARRLPVWQALSDLFLDTELQPSDHRSIAETIRRAGYSIAEADAILRDEVAPTFYANLLSAVGEWTRWPGDYVRARILAHLSRVRRGSKWPRFAWPGKFFAARRMAMVRQDWDQIKGLLAAPEGRA